MCGDLTVSICFCIERRLTGHHTRHNEYRHQKMLHVGYHDHQLREQNIDVTNDTTISTLSVRGPSLQVCLTYKDGPRTERSTIFLTDP